VDFGLWINAKRILLAFKAAAFEEHPACGGIRGAGFALEAKTIFSFASSEAILKARKADPQVMPKA